ncbi:MAG: cytochrome c [Ideonella sp.]|nr:cytochrome c [Ideonella sp.]
MAGSAALAADGQALFKQHCAVCHQETATGTVGLAPSLQGEHWQRLGAERAYLPTVMLKGLAGMIKVGGQPFVGSMPPFAPQLGDEDLAAMPPPARAAGRWRGQAFTRPTSSQRCAAPRAIRPGAARCASRSSVSDQRAAWHAI